MIQYACLAAETCLWFVAQPKVYVFVHIGISGSEDALLIFAPDVLDFIGLLEHDVHIRGRLPRHFLCTWASGRGRERGFGAVRKVRDPAIGVTALLRHVHFIPKR